MDTALVPATDPEADDSSSTDYITSRFASGIYTTKTTAKGDTLALSTDATLSGSIAVPEGGTLLVDGGGFVLRREAEETTAEFWEGRMPGDGGDKWAAAVWRARTPPLTAPAAPRSID